VEEVEMRVWPVILVLALGGPAWGASGVGAKSPPVKTSVKSVQVVRGSPVVLLEADGGKRVIPIWIGAAEAQSIQLRLRGSKALRPLTHDLLDTMLSVLGAKIERVEVDDLVDNVYLGKVTLRDLKGRRYRIDGRPSDLIALAVGAKLPVYVAPQVLQRAGVVPSSVTGGSPTP
jgi:bifunctional DNase/RNase